MKKPDRCSPYIVFFLIAAACAASAVGLSSCKGRQSDAQKVVEEYLRANGGADFKDIKIDLFHTSSNYPDKAYVSVTGEHNYAGQDGNPVVEKLAYILKQDGGSWKVEQGAKYTNDKTKANDYLAGQK